MEITNGNWKQILIEQRRKLQWKDTVIFNIPKGNLVYTVHDYFLCCNGRENAAIFNDLGLDKRSLSLEHYGYDLECGDWPCSNNGDYEALTRLVIALYEKIEKQCSPKKYINKPLEKSKETNLVLPKLKTKLIKIVL